MNPKENDNEIIELTDEELDEIFADDDFDNGEEDAEIRSFYFSNPDPYAKVKPRPDDAPKREFSFDEKGNIVVKNPSAYWLPDIKIVDEHGGTEYTVEDVLRRVRRCKPYIYESGGVTVTGGEPLAQPVFTAALLKALRAEGYHTALDTSGAGALAAAREVLAHTDLVLADLKFSSEEGYRAHTGGSLAHTLDFLALTQELGVPLWVRHVVIPGLTDGEAHIRALARMAGQFHNLQKVELLGFRKLCLEKYGAMGVPFPLADTPEMDAAALCRLEDAVRRELPDLA